MDQGELSSVSIEQAKAPCQNKEERYSLDGIEWTGEDESTQSRERDALKKKTRQKKKLQSTAQERAAGGRHRLEEGRRSRDLHAICVASSMGSFKIMKNRM